MSAVSLCEPSRLQKKNEALVLKDENNVQKRHKITIHILVNSSIHSFFRRSHVGTQPNHYHFCHQISKLVFESLQLHSNHKHHGNEL